MAFCSSSAGDSGFAAARFCAAFLSPAFCFALVLGVLAGDCAADRVGNIAQPNHNTAATTMHRLLIAWIVSRSLELGSGLDPDCARDGVNFHSSAGISHSRA